MSANSGIEWTEATWNPLSGCTRHSPGCQCCYAETMTKRLAAMGNTKYQGLLDKNGRFNGTINLDEDALTIPLRRRKPTVYFVNSMSDLFHENVSDEFIDRVWEVMNDTPRHRYIILTKRADRQRAYLDNRGRPLPNVVNGVSAENQKYADVRINDLMNTFSVCRIVSAEPLLGPIDFSRWMPHLDQIIVGGESGPGARPCEIAWIRDIVCQCKDAGVACFVKQLGAKPMEPAPGKPTAFERPGMLWRKCLRSAKGGDPDEWPADLRVREVPDVLAR